jgi:hypothetical protein
LWSNSTPCVAYGRGAITGFRRLTLAIERAATSLDEARANRRRQIDYLQTLIDNVSVAVIVLNEDGSVTLLLVRIEANILGPTVTLRNPTRPAPS